MKVFLLLLLCMNFLHPTFEPAWGQIAIIVHKSVPIDSASPEQIADIYRLKVRKWENGNQIVLYNLKRKEDLKSQFYKFIKENPLNLKKLWMRLQLTGEAMPPDGLDTEEEVIEKVASTPGAIGFVSKEKVNDDVKVIASTAEEALQK